MREKTCFEWHRPENDGYSQEVLEPQIFLGDSLCQFYSCPSGWRPREKIRVLQGELGGLEESYAEDQGHLLADPFFVGSTTQTEKRRVF